MSCSSCCSSRQLACCEQAPSIDGHTASVQLSEAQLARSSCHACSSHLKCCCSYDLVSQATPIKIGEASYGCLCQTSPSPHHHVCSSCFPSHHPHHHHTHHHHPPPHHHHQPAVASPLLHSHHCHHRLQTTPTEHIAKLHPPLMDPSPLCQSTSHRMQGGSAICLSKSHGQIEESLSIYHSTAHPSLEPSPLSRPHPRMQLHSSSSYGSRPHREKLFTPKSEHSSGSKLLPPTLEFSPASSQSSPPVSRDFQLGVASGSSPGNISSPKKDFSLNKTTKQVSQAPVVDDVAVSCNVQGDVTVPPTRDIDHRTSEPEVKVLDAKSTPPTNAPPTKAAGSQGSTKSRSPILLYRWCFKVLSKGMVILLGFKSQDSEELKWRSGPVSERLSPTLLMTRSGQLYHLMGALSRDEMDEESPDFNQQMMKKFKRGFPSDWEDLLCKPKPLSVPHPKEEQPVTPDLASEQEERKKPTTSSSSSHGSRAGAIIKKRIKKEVPDDPLVMLTPLLSDSDISTPGSSFVSSIKRSSRGRIIKPARSTVSPYLTNCNDLYTYDWHGNFQGINSSVIDLTLCDDPLPTKKHIKKEPVEQKSSKNSDHSTEAPSTSVVPPTITKAPPTTEPTKKKRGRPRKVKVCDEIPMQISKSMAASERESDVESRYRARQLAPCEVRKWKEKELRGERSASGGSTHDSDAETGHRARQQPSGDKRRREIGTRRERSASGGSRDSDAETRHRARQQPSGDERRREIGTRRERSASGGSRDSDAETRHRARQQPSGDERRREKEIRRERTASGRSRDSDAETRHRRELTRQPGQNRKSKTKGVERERKVSGGSVGDHKIDQGIGKKAYASSAGGKENRRGVSRVLLSSEEESEEEIKTKSRQRAGKNIHSKNRKLYITESETASDQSEVETANEKDQHLSVGVPRQQKVMVNDRIDAFSPLLSPAGKKTIGERIDKMSQSELGHKKEHKPIKPCLVRPSDPMNGFSVLLSPVKKKSRWGGGVEESETCTSSATLSEPRDSKMTQTELRNLRQVVHSVPALTTNFWEVVARQMNTGHTAHQCSTAYHEQSQRSRMKPPSQRPRPKQPAEPNVTKVTGGAGTLKRKRQLRDALVEMDKDYYDDIFESTPLKKLKKSVTIPEHEDDNFEGEENSYIEGEKSNAPRPILCHTPSSAQSRVGAPLSHTPNLCDYLTTPDLKSGLKRAAADHVIYKAQKAQKQGGIKKSVSFQKPLASSSSNGRSKPYIFEEKLRNIRTGELTTLRMFEDSDDSSSSEDTDPFEDVLTTLS